jgi:pimeloyl-ACP methyl ester carboxylesterase
MEVWAEQHQALADAGFSPVLVDMRGHGASDKPGGPYSVEGWASDLTALLDALEIDRAALVGHSIGCTVVEQASVALGERCTALAMLGGALAFSDEFKAVLRERAAMARAGRLDEIGEAVATAGLTERAHAERPELVRRVVEMIASNDPEAYALSAEATAAGSMLDPERVGCPALAFTGAEDLVGPPEDAERIASAVPGGEATTVAGGAHMCMIEVGDRVSAILLDFLRKRGIG